MLRPWQAGEIVKITGGARRIDLGIFLRQTATQVAFECGKTFEEKPIKRRFRKSDRKEIGGDRDAFPAEFTRFETGEQAEAFKTWIDRRDRKGKAAAILADANRARWWKLPLERLEEIVTDLEKANAPKEQSAEAVRTAGEA